MFQSSKVPVSVLTGFLGAGKTTFLNALLADPKLANTAVIINEFGEIGLDHLFVETVDEGIIELSSGCLCCTIRGDLVETLNDLEDRMKTGAMDALDRVIIETTGLADPAPILQTIMQLSDTGPYVLDGVVTLVDAVNAGSTLDAHSEARRQVAVADRLVLSKTDLVASDVDRNKVIARLRELNPMARLFDTQKPDGLVASDLFRTTPEQMADKAGLIRDWLGDQQEDGSEAGHPGHEHPGQGHTEQEHTEPGHGHHHGPEGHDVNRHDDKIRAFTLATDEPVSSRAFQMFVELLSSAHGPHLLRVKGIIQLEEKPDTPLVLHGVQHIFHPPVFLDRWPDSDHRTRLVFITYDLEESFVSELFDAFVGKIAVDRPDKMALTDNPLAVPGMSGPYRPS